LNIVNILCHVSDRIIAARFSNRRTTRTKSTHLASCNNIKTTLCVYEQLNKFPLHKVRSSKSTWHIEDWSRQSITRNALQQVAANTHVDVQKRQTREKWTQEIFKTKKTCLCESTHKHVIDWEIWIPKRKI